MCSEWAVSYLQQLGDRGEVTSFCRSSYAWYCGSLLARCRACSSVVEKWSRSERRGLGVQQHSVSSEPWQH